MKKFQGNVQVLKEVYETQWSLGMLQPFDISQSKEA